MIHPMPELLILLLVTVIKVVLLVGAFFAGIAFGIHLRMRL
jgi:hypothetical protein